MPFFMLSIFVQVALVVHIFKNGKNTTWIWVVVGLPLAGSIAYIIVEVLLPILSGKRTGSKAARSTKILRNPNQSLKGARRRYTISDTVENATALADELVEQEKYAEAVELYRDSLQGSFKNDPAILNKLAFSLYLDSQYAQAKQCLDDLIEYNPDYKNADAHLLYARCLNELNETEAAIHEYEALSQYYPGPEANYRFALLLIDQQRLDDAREYLQSIMTRAEQSPPHYTTLHKEWLLKTKNLLRAC